MIELTRELLMFGHAEADEWGNQHRYNAARKLWSMFGDVIECAERAGDHGQTIVVITHKPPKQLKGVSYEDEQRNRKTVSGNVDGASGNAAPAPNVGESGASQ